MDREEYFYSLVQPKRRPKDKKRRCIKCFKMRDSTPENRVCSTCVDLRKAIGERAYFAYPDPYQRAN
jgi:hypothetical protein